MTLLDLVKYMRESILDDTGGVGVDWQALYEDDVASYQLRWTNEELTFFLNAAYDKAVRSSFLIKKSEPDLFIPVIAATAEYQLDPLIIRLKQLTLDSTGRELMPVEYEELSCIRNWRDKKGTPTSYVIDEVDNTIRLYPEPLVDDTVSIIYYRLPLLKLSWDDNLQPLEIKPEHQVDMVDYAVYMAYNKDDANTLDPTRALTYLNKFERNFGHSSVYGEIRRKRSRNRGVSYGGLMSSSRINSRWSR